MSFAVAAALGASVLAMALLAAGCAGIHARSATTFEVRALSARGVDGEDVSVSGYLRMDDGMSLYQDRAAADAHDYAAEVDVVAAGHAARMPAPSDIGTGRCARVQGTFLAFDDDRIGMGYFRSKLGYVKARDVVLTACEEPNPPPA